jgi:glutamate synthase (NADPH/NADH) large chain
MSGGIAYVLDRTDTFAGRVNYEMVNLEELDDDDREFLAEVVAEHAAETGSEIARALLADWPAALGMFRMVLPKDYRRVLEATRRATEQGLDVVEEIMRASQI